MSEPFFYLASPYSHPDPEVRVARFRAVSAAAGWMIASGLHVYCPIAMTHPIEEELLRPLPHEKWMELDRVFLNVSSGLVQLTLPGWENSKGMAMELSWAMQLKLPRMVLKAEDCVPNGLLDFLKARA